MERCDTRESIKVVTSNTFITAKALTGLSLKARKLLYVAISQCRQEDEEFKEYCISIKDFADLMGIAPSNVYSEADCIMDELQGVFLRIEFGTDKKRVRRYSLFTMSEYDKSVGLYFQFNPDMKEFFLGLKRDFTQALLHDFTKMRSPFSIAIWHLMQREMYGKKPMRNHSIEFDLTLEELREVTGTQHTFTQLVNFKAKVLDKAIREIRDNCGVDISYVNIKYGKTVRGFHFTATQHLTIDPSTIDPKKRLAVEARAAELRKLGK